MGENSFMNLSILLLLAALAALAYAAFNFFSVKHLEEGTETMQKIAAAIRVGANTFIGYEYKVLVVVVLIVAAIVWLALEWYVAVALLLGSTMSALAGFIGMKIATYANVRVTNEARKTENIGQSRSVAVRSWVCAWADSRFWVLPFCSWFSEKASAGWIPWQRQNAG